VTTDAPRTPPRVVSLLPAATEIVAALGAVDQLVGVTHECDHPRAVAALPRVTSSAVDRDATSAAIDAEVRALASTGAPVFGFDAERFATLAPEVVLTQSLCDVCALPESEVDRAIAAVAVAPHVVTLGGTTLDGVWDDVRRVGAAIGRSAEAEALLASLDARMRRVHETLKAARAPRPRVAVIEWLDPLFVAGTGPLSSCAARAAWTCSRSPARTRCRSTSTPCAPPRRRCSSSRPAASTSSVRHARAPRCSRATNGGGRRPARAGRWTGTR